MDYTSLGRTGLRAGSVSQANEGRRSGEWARRDLEKYSPQLEDYWAF